MGQCRSKSSLFYDDTLHFEQTYTIISKLGSGGFGTIYTALHNKTCSEVVVKKINKRSQLQTDMLEDGPVPREVKIMAGISHPGVVQLLDYYTIPKYYLLILQYLPGWVDLFDYTAKIRYLEEKTAKRIMKQVFGVLDHLHTVLAVAHLDMKPENVLINPADHTIKLIDFGNATYITGNMITEFEGTRQYACPDILFRGKFDPVDADIWSCGVMLYRLVLGNLPFQRPEEYYEQLKFPRRRPELSLYCKHIITLTLCRQSELRPKSMKELLGTPWIAF